MAERWDLGGKIRGKERGDPGTKVGMKEEMNWEVEGWRKHSRTLARI